VLGANYPLVDQPLIQRRRFLLSGLITPDGFLPWCAMTICRAESRTASPAGDPSQTTMRPSLPWSESDRATLFRKVSSTRFAPPSPTATGATWADNRPLASSVTSSRRSSARSMLKRYPAATPMPGNDRYQVTSKSYAQSVSGMQRRRACRGPIAQQDGSFVGSCEGVT
jgi:hypothetical protein